MPTYEHHAFIKFLPASGNTYSYPFDALVYVRDIDIDIDICGASTPLQLLATTPVVPRGRVLVFF